MKLRIQSNSIRVRLTRVEVAALAAGKTVSQITEFTPATKLISSIRTSPQTTAPVATFDSSRIEIVLPHEPTRLWAGSDEVSIQAEQSIDVRHSLALLIEKDFECLHHREENQDAFPNPRKQNAV